MGETNRLLQNTFFDSFLGMPFYLVEPELTKSHQSNYTHILACEEEELLPLKWGVKTARPTPIILPPTTNEIFFFILDAEKIKLHRSRVVLNPCCRGYQCDRQKKAPECLCIHRSALSPITYEFDVEIHVDPKDFMGQSTQVCKFRSYRTTSVFFRKFVETSGQSLIPNEKKSQRERRDQIEAITEYINHRCGWTVVGWCKRGEITVEGEQEKVENNDVTLHLTYLFPTDDLIIEEPDFQELQIDCFHDNEKLAAALGED